MHRAHGGVVPEIASRNHALRLRPLVSEALATAGLEPASIDAFAATRGPGDFDDEYLREPPAVID